MVPVALEPARSSPGQSSSVYLAELALAVGGFGIGTGEFGIMGLDPDGGTRHQRICARSGGRRASDCRSGREAVAANAASCLDDRLCRRQCRERARFRLWLARRAAVSDRVAAP